MTNKVTRIGINGFGRIGRCVFRAAAEHSDIEIVGINDLGSTKTLFHLLKYDSAHGTFGHDVKLEGDFFVMGDKKIPITQHRDPREIPWGAWNTDIILECTGVFRTKEKAGLHLQSDGGENRAVIVSAPSPDADKTVVYGVNHNILAKGDKVFSNASCTTNCLAPIAHVLNSNWGIEKGFMTTIHSSTNDQVVIDAPHSDLRRARSVFNSIIPTTTGAAKAVGLVIPELKGKLDGQAVRVPTMNVSVVELHAVLKSSATAEEINEKLIEASNGYLNGVLGITSEPLVSLDFNGNPHSSIVDTSLTQVIDGNLVRVQSWYDNETGFSNRLLDVSKFLMSL